MANKIDKINHLLHERTPDVVVITEHGLTETQLKNTVLNGYTLINGYCRKNHLKGGVAIYVHSHTEPLTVSMNTYLHSTELICELSMIKLRTTRRDMYIMGIYRPPKANLEDSLHILSRSLDEITLWNNDIVIVGDINVDNFEKDAAANTNRTKLKECLANYNIKRLDIGTTRKTSNTETSIDCVCSNFNQNNIQVDVLSTGISDHRAQLCFTNVAFEKPKQAIVNKRLFTNQRLEELKYLLRQETWDETYSAENVNTSYNTFLNTLTENMNTACPVTKVKNRGKKKQIYNWNEEVNTLKRNLISAQEEYLTTGEETHKQEMIEKKKEYDLKIKKLRKEATANRVENAENKSRELWRIVNSERSSGNDRSSAILELNINGETIHDPIVIAEKFNNFFVNVAATTLAEAGQNGLKRENVRYQHDVHNLTLYPTTEEEMKNIICSIKPKTSCGYDEIPSKLLRHCMNELTSPLVHIVNKSFEEGTFPDRLKLSKVYPKLKKGDDTQLNSYRPISLVPTFSKVLEKAALVRLRKHVEEHELQTKSQHGFTKGRSTNTAIIDLVETMIDQIEDGNTATGIFLDLSKAFDCLSHSLLLQKLRSIGVRGASAAWFTSYLGNRTQVVEVTHKCDNKITSTRSSPLPIKSGVPQGSVLGPVLFTLFVNDLPFQLADFSEVHMYADDTALTLGTKHPDCLDIQSYIAYNMAVQYCHQNDLVVNEEKTQQLVIGKKKEEVSGIPGLAVSTEIKHLGVTLDQNLTWNKHVDNVCGKLSSGLYVLKRMSQISEDKTIRTTYFALFESHLRYGLAVWGYSSVGNLQRVLVLQKKAVRVMAKLGFRDSCRNAFKELRILTVVSLFILETTMFARSINVEKRGNVHHYGTRNANSFDLPAHRLKLFEKKPSFIGAKFSNLLPAHITQLDVKHFRRGLMNWLLDRPFYSVEEFLNWEENY